MRLCNGRTCTTAVIKFVALAVVVYLFISIMGLSYVNSVENAHRTKHILSEHTIPLVNTSLNPEACETLHLALVLTDHWRVPDAVHMLKTVLYFRQSSLVLHIVTNPGIKHIISTLIQTWELPSVEVKFYKYTKPKTTELPVLELKLNLHNILPADVSKIYVLDDRLRFLTDIQTIWKQFNNFDDYQIIALPKKGDQEVYYTDQMLIHLTRLRENPSLFSRDEAFKTWMDAFAFITIRRKYVRILPCSTQVRLQSNFNASLCLTQSEPQVLWWDSHSATFYTQNQLVESKKNVIHSIMHSDGELFRHSISSCIKPSTPTQYNFPTSCQEFRLAGKLKRRTHLYLYGDPNQGESKDPYGITLVTQLTPNRFGVLERMVTQWAGPLHAVFHVTEEEGLKLQEMAVKSPVIKKRRDVYFHAVYKRGLFNPINYLRNVGINETKTPYVFFVDVDLVPNKNIYTNLQMYIEKYSEDKHAVLVVPTFNSFIPLDKYPDDKATLVGLIKNKSVEGYKMSRGWNLGHKPTNYPKWMNATKPYPAIFHDAFEPYVVMKTSEQPQFEEQLLERMGDKTAFGRMLYAREYELLILPDQYIIHLPHPTSEGTNMWKSYPGYGRCAGILFEEFRKETKLKYPNQKVH